MNNELDIGKTAKKLDSKPMIERMKIEKRSIKKILIAILFYVSVIALFSILL